MLLLVAFLSLRPTFAVADTYKAITVGGEWETLAVNDYGDALMFAPFDRRPCVGQIPSTALNCYVLFNYSTGATSVSYTPPYFVEDPDPAPGPGCPTSPAGYNVVICNNGHYLYLDGHGLYDGPDPLTDEVFGDAPFDIKMSPSGNVLLEGAFSDTTVELVDLTTLASTPEPSSLALLGTGLLAFTGVLRRRRL